MSNKIKTRLAQACKYGITKTNNYESSNLQVRQFRMHKYNIISRGTMGDD